MDGCEVVFGRSILVLVVNDVFTKWCPVMVNDCLTRFHGEWCNIAFKDFHIMDGQLQSQIHVHHNLGQCSKPYDFRYFCFSPRRSNVQLVGRWAGETDSFHDNAVNLWSLHLLELQESIRSAVERREGYLVTREEMSTDHADVLINVNWGEQPLGMPLGSVKTIIQYITKTSILIFWIMLKMYSTCNLALDIGFQNSFAANILSTKSVY